jgi:hypothetical protein
MTPSGEEGRCGGVDEDVEAAEGCDGGADGFGDGFAAADVDAGGGGELLCEVTDFSSRRRGRGFVAVGDDDVRAARGGEQGDFAADAAGHRRRRMRCGG